MKILISGVHGFVGSNLVKYLSDGNTIYGLDIVAPVKEGVVKTFGWEDLDNGLVPDVDAIIHLAGKAHDTRNRSAAEVYFKVNTGLTEKIFDWYLASPTAKKFVFFSTAKAAAEKVPEVLLSGHHGKVADWRTKESYKRTITRRPDMWEKYDKSVIHSRHQKKENSSRAGLYLALAEFPPYSDSWIQHIHYVSLFFSCQPKARKRYPCPHQRQKSRLFKHLDLVYTAIWYGLLSHACYAK